EGKGVVNTGKALPFVRQGAGKEKNLAVRRGTKQGKGSSKVSKAFRDRTARSFVYQPVDSSVFGLGLTRLGLTLVSGLCIAALGLRDRRQHWQTESCLGLVVRLE